jgi:hypothetical protein
VTIEVVQSTVPEVLLDDATQTVVVADVIVETITVDGDEVLTETTSVETVIDSIVSTVYVPEVETQVIETSEQGPAGPPGNGVTYPGRTLTYSLGLLTGVWLYLDAAKTQLAERRILAYTLGGQLTNIAFYDGAGALTKTRTLTYSGGVLTSITDV